MKPKPKLKLKCPKCAEDTHACCGLPSKAMFESLRSKISEENLSEYERGLKDGYASAIRQKLYEHAKWIESLPPCSNPPCGAAGGKAHRFFRLHNDHKMGLCDKCFDFIERIWIAQEFECKPFWKNQ